MASHAFHGQWLTAGHAATAIAVTVRRILGAGSERRRREPLGTRPPKPHTSIHEKKKGGEKVTSTTLSSGSVRRWLTYSLVFGALALVWMLSMARPASAAPGMVVSDEHAQVKNSGHGVATTGQNNTVGNSSTNIASNDQRVGGRAVAYNSAATRNTSTGTSYTKTGSANAVGNQSTTSVTQLVNADGFDGLALIRQNFDAVNIGSGEAISGSNTATGNGSFNSASTSQGAFTRGSTAVNTASTTNWSDGIAAIATGDSSATGNTASTTSSQIANATPGTAHGIALIDQTAAVNTRGLGFAGSGGNTAFGNASSNTASAVQGAVSARGPPAPVASNSSEATNSSNGTAHIETGSATATGNSSETFITQEDTASTKLPNLVDSSSSVSNRGSARAVSGANRAAGNSSSNTATNSQGASGGGPAVNFGATTNWSNGSADITTGWANALGNQSTTDTDVTNRGAATAISGNNTAVGNASGSTAGNAQRTFGGRIASNTATVSNNSDGSASVTTGSAKALGNDATSSGGTVINRGIATAVTGVNNAVGNRSTNVSTNGQFAAAGQAFNLANVDNHSTGSASVVTGAADAMGNKSTTIVSQEDSGSDDPWVDISQDVLVVNRGTALALTGSNTATGNASHNAALSAQRALGVSLAVNNGNSVSHSGGTASILTGSATAVGNKATTTVDQSAMVNATTSPLALVGQTITIRNIGDATAVSGRNTGTGNGSVNLGLNRQLAGAVAAVHSSSGSAQNHSDGSSDVSTGSSWAVGNDTETAGTQGLKSGTAAV